MPESPLRDHRADIEMHDSWLLGMEVSSDGSGIVEFNAYVHRKSTEGEDIHEGGYQRVQMVITQMRVEGYEKEPEVDIYRGSLEVDSMLLNGVVPFPVSYAGSIRLKMTTREGVEIVVEGQSINISAVGDFEFVEIVAGSWP